MSHIPCITEVGFHTAGHVAYNLFNKLINLLLYDPFVTFCLTTKKTAKILCIAKILFLFGMPQIRL